MKNKLRNIVLGMALVVSYGVAPAANNTSVSKMMEAPLEEFSKSSSTVVFNGKRYAYKVDLKNAFYQDEEAVKLVPINELELGETYYFQLFSDSDKNNFKNVIFIAKEPQAE